ncbi:thrombospondin type 1 domain-containing protein [Cryptosporidium muris RN66]|uniref:Thrombospondin type 1 domain-containing protein n=1 Tax=Cryptosporidium muris (strain RN66) TaxID=441375 RepID=B6ADP1_CRYMR|nr:thrombospondin type 1 domain-containing protein [Cryptosporidium muris RN66]EEA06332.1 thrombospondin type 1 domain-containing protein [Cryptosporidium muris RN66]|eukprot:XP_002140681.1 thrombospondin type 1 domain-containing protein [Cryptosporidium muris RN66]
MNSIRCIISFFWIFFSTPSTTIGRKAFLNPLIEQKKKVNYALINPDGEIKEIVYNNIKNFTNTNTKEEDVYIGDWGILTKNESEISESALLHEIYKDLMTDPQLAAFCNSTIFNFKDRTHIYNLSLFLEINSQNISDQVDSSFNEPKKGYSFVSWLKPENVKSKKNYKNLNLIDCELLDRPYKILSSKISNKIASSISLLFPMWNFTEQDQFSDLYKHFGSPIMTTQYLKDIDFDSMSNEILQVLYSTMRTLNSTAYTLNSQLYQKRYSNECKKILGSKQEVSNKKNNWFSYWCNNLIIHKTPQILNKNCQYYGEWTPWSRCSNFCGWGIQTRGRRVDETKISSLNRMTSVKLLEEYKLMNCDSQIQTQGCISVDDCCEYEVPLENKWVNCTSNCFVEGSEFQIVNLIKSKNINNQSCSKTKRISRRCSRLEDQVCKKCEYSVWSSWSTCVMENSSYVQYRERSILTTNCTNHQGKYNHIMNHPSNKEVRLCRNADIFTHLVKEPETIDNFENMRNSTLNNIQAKPLLMGILSEKDLIRSIPQNLLENEGYKVDECIFVVAESSYYDSTLGSCVCPKYMKPCIGYSMENTASRWKQQVEEICESISNKKTKHGKNLIFGFNRKRFDCKSKSWVSYSMDPPSGICANSFILCQPLDLCVVSEWTNWSGCSSPCKSSIRQSSKVIRSDQKVYNPIIVINSKRRRTRDILQGSCSIFTTLQQENCNDLPICPDIYFKFKTNMASFQFKDFLNNYQTNFNDSLSINIDIDHQNFTKKIDKSLNYSNKEKISYLFNILSAVIPYNIEDILLAQKILSSKCELFSKDQLNINGTAMTHNNSSINPIIFDKEEDKSNGCICPSGYIQCNSAEFYFGMKSNYSLNSASNSNSTINNNGNNDQEYIDYSYIVGAFSDSMFYNHDGTFHKVPNSVFRNYCIRKDSRTFCRLKQSRANYVMLRDLFNTNVAIEYILENATLHLQ